MGREAQYTLTKITTKYHNHCSHLLEKSLQTQEFHPGTVGRPNPGSGHLEEWSQDWALAILLDQGYHHGVGAWVQEEGCCSLLVTTHSIQYK